MSHNDENIPSDGYSSNSDSETESKAVENIKSSLNLATSSQPNQSNQKVYYDTSVIPESSNNLPSSQQIDFNDVMKAFTSDINETTKANLSKAIKTHTQSKHKNMVEIKFNDKADKILERTMNYKQLSHEISQYQPKVKEQREADILDFTKKDNKTNKQISKKSAKEIANQFKEQNDFEKEIKNILINNKCESDDKVIERENEELLKISPEEMKRRHEELRRYRSLLFQQEISNKRENKIKAKLRRKIQKKKREKEEMDMLEELKEIDPDAVQNYLEKKKMKRIEERMTLKHSINSKFQKTVKHYHLDKDKQMKEHIKENFQLRDKLLQKIKGEDEDEENEMDDDVDDNELSEAQEEGEEEENEEQEGKVVLDFEEKDKNTDENDNNENSGIPDSGVFSMKFMKNANNAQNSFKNLKKEMNINEDEEIFEESEDDENDKKSKSDDETPSPKKQPKQQKEKKSSLTNITSSDLNKISSDAKQIISSSVSTNNPKVTLNTNDLTKILADENIEEDHEQFNRFVIENETNKNEFLESENKEQLEKIKKENPEFMSGWGSWTGESTQIKAKEYLQKKRYENKIKRLQDMANENSSKNPFVKINNSIDKNFSNYLVKDLPRNVNKEEFERLHNGAVGREWNTLTTYKHLIQPRVVKKIGQIIEPMNMNDKVKAKKLVDIIEKATKKKQRTKTKL